MEKSGGEISGMQMSECRGLSLMSGGLDSQLAIKILQNAGAKVEAICFSSPFFSHEAAAKAAENLGVELHIVDFTADEVALVKNPPHGFGGAMNPCIDCHATMIKRAGELMVKLGYDFVATGEVLGQRPMSQNRQSLGIVERTSGLGGRLIRPLSAKLLDPTIPETEGKIDREKLLDISGRSRERQIALAKEFNIIDYPSPAGGCKLTETGYCRKLKDLLDNEGLDDRRLLDLLVIGRRFRLPGGTGVILGRDQRENAVLQQSSALGMVVAPVNVPGPTALLPVVKCEGDLDLAKALVCSYSRYDRLEGEIELNCGKVARPYDREAFKRYQIC